MYYGDLPVWFKIGKAKDEETPINLFFRSFIPGVQTTERRLILKADCEIGVVGAGEVFL
jgi:hypothetical protein